MEGYSMFKFIENFLKKIEEENNKSFGNGKLNCCDLNKGKSTVKNTVKNTNNKNK